MLSPTYRDAVTKVVQACLSNPGADHNLASIAAQVGYSPFHFHRLFGAMMGESPAGFLRRIRMEFAARKLADGESVSYVAVESGFGNPDTFSRAFRAAYGCLPSHFGSPTCNILLPAPNGVHFGATFAINFQSYRGLTMNIRIEESPELNVLGFRYRGPYSGIGSTFRKLGQWAAQNKVDMRGAVGVYHDDPALVAQEDLKADALIIVPEPTNAPVGMVAYTIPSAKMLVAEYKGDYSGLAEAWQKTFGEEIPNRNLQIADGYCYERYLNDIATTPVQDLRTDIHVPIQ